MSMKASIPETPVGRKYITMLIGCFMLLLGIVVFKYLDVNFEHYDKYMLGVLGVTQGYNVFNVLNKKFTNGGNKNGSN